MSDKAGSFIIDIEDKFLSREEQEIIAHPIVGGVILFKRNYDSQEQLQDLCQQIRASRQSPLLIMADQEGGRVQRFINEFTRLPAMAIFGTMYDADPANACYFAKECGWLMAIELLSVGIDLSLAPVLDLYKEISSVIGDRAFHASPQAVIYLAKAFIEGMQEAGMASVGKHFPGHGSVNLDSHIAIPIDERPLTQIEGDDMVPFIGLIKSGISAIMAAHIVFPEIDKLPVGFSRIWLQDILRAKLKFTGTIVSDDLNMKGADISPNYTDRVAAARDAGCDFAILCNNRKGVIQVLDNLPYASYMVSKEKWNVLQGNYSNIKKPLNVNQRWQKIHEFLLKNYLHS